MAQSSPMIELIIYLFIYLFLFFSTKVCQEVT